MQAPERLGELPVARHRVCDSRRADHTCVRRDEENGRRENADVDLRNRQHRPVQAEVLDKPEHRIVLEAVRRRLPKLRHVVRALMDDRHRRERDPRQREVDREDRDRDPRDRAWNRAHRVARLLGEVRHRLDSRIGDHRHGDREQERAPRRRDAEMDVPPEQVGVEDEEEPEPDQQKLRREVDHGENDVQLRRLLDTDHVQADQQPRQDDADDDVPRIRPQRSPEDREVMRNEDHRDRDGDHVVEHLRPGGAEGDELVERVTREAGRPSSLWITDGAFGVGGRRCGEDDPADDEDDRGQAERDPGRQAERVVDRRADVAVRGCE